MAKIDIVKMTTLTTGTGTITLGSAVAGFLTIASYSPTDGTVFTYTIRDGNNTEVGVGTYTVSGTTLSRDRVIASTNAGAKINLSGSATVAISTSGENLGIEAHWDSFTTTAVANGATTQIAIDAADFWLQDYGYVTLASDTFTVASTTDGWFRISIEVKVTSGGTFNGPLTLILKWDGNVLRRWVQDVPSGAGASETWFSVSLFHYIGANEAYTLEVKNNTGGTATCTVKSFTWEPREHGYFSI